MSKVLAYQFVNANQIKYPSTWDSEQMPGEYWLVHLGLVLEIKSRFGMQKEVTSLTHPSVFHISVPAIRLATESDIIMVT